MIGENGVRLSGGQKQSIDYRCFKRVPYHTIRRGDFIFRPTRKKVQNVINNLTKNRTTLVIALVNNS